MDEKTKDQQISALSNEVRHKVEVIYGLLDEIASLKAKVVELEKQNNYFAKESSAWMLKYKKMEGAAKTLEAERCSATLRPQALLAKPMCQCEIEDDCDVACSCPCHVTASGD